MIKSGCSSFIPVSYTHLLMNALINTITIALLAATASTLLGSIAAIGIFKQMMKEFGFKYVVSTLRESFSATHNGWKADMYKRQALSRVPWRICTIATGMWAYRFLILYPHCIRTIIK